MSWYRRLFNLTRRDALAREVDREIAFHLSERAEELLRLGMSEDEARREARRRFGHVQTQKERTRDADVAAWLESLAADVRYGSRALRLSPGFTFVAVISIGLGVGANTAIFSLINAVMLKSLPVPHAEQLVKITQDTSGTSLTNPLWEQIRDHQDALDAFAYGTTTFNLATGGEARHADGSWVSGSYFPVLGASALAGRLLSRADDNRGCPPVAVVSAGFAAREYGTPDAAVGRTVSLDGHSFDIVGVTEAPFFGMDVGARVDVFAPICSGAVLAGGATRLEERSRWFLHAMGRPRGRLTLQEVNVRLAAASPGIHAATLPPRWPSKFQSEYLKRTLVATAGPTGYSDVRASYRDALFALMVVVGVVLLIACANVAHLLLARSATRQREMALRLALGAGRSRLIRQLLTESVLLALLGSALGVIFARWASALTVRLLSDRNSQVWLDLGLDLKVFGFTIGIATASGILFGLVPAWKSMRVAPQTALQGRGSVGGPRRFSATKGLVVGQVALSLVLLVAAGLLLRSFQGLAAVDPGFRREGVLLVNVDVENGGYREDQHRAVFRDILDRMRALPGVRSASASLVTPISGSGWNGDVEAEGFVPKSQHDALVWFNGVSDRFFATMGTARIAGRDFDARDVAGGAPVAIVNAAMARKVFGTANPMGRRFQTHNGKELTPPIEVVGVVQDAKYESLDETETATAYLPVTQADLWGGRMHFELHGDGDLTAIIPEVRRLAGEVNRAISLEFVTLSEQVAASLTRPRLLATLAAFFAALALLLATIGLYGTVAYSVARRQNEIGIRIALGADRSRVVRMVLAEVAALMAGGALLGVLLAIASTRLLTSFLYGLTATDPTTLTIAVGAFGVVALAAGALPAWRAARLDPREALRQE